MPARIRAVEGHVFLPDDIEAVTGEYVDAALMVSHRLATDTHLPALARRHDARLVTLDRGIAALTGAGGTDVVVISPRT